MSERQLAKQADRAAAQPHGSTVAQPAQSGQPARLLQSHHMQETWSAPIPPPDVLMQFNEIRAGLGAELVDMWTREVTHRQTQERKLLDAQIEQQRTLSSLGRQGQNWTGAVSLSGLIACMVIAWINPGNGVALAIAAMFGVGGLATVLMPFLQKRKAQPQAEQPKS